MGTNVEKNWQKNHGSCLAEYISSHNNIIILIRAGTIRSAAVSIIFDTDIADTIHIQYNTHEYDLWFQNQEFWISTTK